MTSPIASDREDMGSHRFLNLSGTCRSCGSTAYTVRELTLHFGQQFRCYACFDRARYPNWQCIDDLAGIEREASQ